jgi:GTP-binding protein
MNVEKVEFLKSAYNPDAFPREILPTVAFAGRSNVGKSSVINRLLRKKDIARVSSKPGKTICVNYFVINNKYYFVDLPGYGYSKVSKEIQNNWKHLIESFFKNNESLKCTIIIIDIRVGIDVKDKILIDWLTSIKIPFIVIATKCDKISNMSIYKYVETIRKELGDTIPFIPFSSRNDRWTSTLWGEIDKCLFIS